MLLDCPESDHMSIRDAGIMLSSTVMRVPHLQPGLMCAAPQNPLRDSGHPDVDDFFVVQKGCCMGRHTIIFILTFHIP